MGKRLTDAQIAHFKTTGLLIAENVLSEEDLAPVIAGYSRWIDQRARELHAAGKITNLAEDLPFEKRFGVLHAQCREIEAGMDVMNARLPEFFAFLRCRNFLDAAEDLIGTPELLASPIQHIRGKIADPSEGSYFNVPWHQDAAVTWEEADHSEIVTCWLPLVDATVENGCMQVLPNVFLGGVLPHISGPGGATVRPDALPETAPVAAAVKKGGVVFMHRCTPHRSTPNRTDIVRWSLDLRFQPSDQPTGRPWLPGFVVRSENDPESVVTDYAAWDRAWAEALAAPPPTKSAHRTI
jgi:phytanoyl-CoA hydroxylase